MRKQLIMGFLIAVAIGGIVFAFSAPSREEVTPKPAAVETVTPVGGDLDLRQTTISADLAPGYEGYLTFDGIEIGDDDLRRVPALNSITLVPQPDSDYIVLQPGRHCAGVVYWPIGLTRNDGATYQWCFNLH
ncbi:MAG: hypothetical protein ACRD12_04410 [Acidimicrobiales bacterium]